jgi:cation diffusion facilitator CzcD-associated flavoprotein CzcO
METDCDVAIVGAGPYGLSLAAHLARHRVGFRIFGEPMQFWSAHMPKGMHLKSDGFASDLFDADRSFTLKQFCAQEGLPYRDTALPVALDIFVKYGVAFQQKFVPNLEKKNVASVQRTANGFLLKLDDGEIVSARKVVVAAGINSFRHIPSSLAHLPPEFLTHSSDHHDLRSFEKRSVVVLGGGSSATDLAALLLDAGADAQLVARDNSIRFLSGGDLRERSWWERMRHPTSGIGPGWRSRFYCDAPWLFRHLPERLRFLIVRRTLGPAGGWFMKERVMGRVPMTLGSRVQSAEVKNNKVELTLRSSDGSERKMVADHIIAATGYKVDMRRYEFLDPEILADLATVENTPVLSAAMESSVSGLYFIGGAAANSFGPVMRFAFGASFAAPRVARSLVRTLPRQKT